MDYVGIGKRIRTQRLKKDLSQEELAEMAGISLVHMSHIETANTKLSLPVFVDIAEALDVQTDALLFDSSRRSVSSIIEETAAILEACDAKQARVLAEIIQTAKQAMDAYLST